MVTVLKRVFTAVLIMAVVLVPSRQAYAEPAASETQEQTEAEAAPINPGAATEGMTFEEARQAAYDTPPDTTTNIIRPVSPSCSRRLLRWKMPAWMMKCSFPRKALIS